MLFTGKINIDLLLSHFVVNISTTNIGKLFQYYFLNVEATSINIPWLNFDFQPNINFEITLGHRHWIHVILSTLFQRRFVNVETTSINIRPRNSHFKSNSKVETTSVHRRWINVILLTLFQCCFANFEAISINERLLNFYYQPNIKIVGVFARFLFSCLALFFAVLCYNNFFVIWLQSLRCKTKIIARSLVHKLFNYLLDICDLLKWR